MVGSVAIIGAGDLGGAVAHALASRGRVGRVLIVDPVARVAAGKALDIQQSGPIGAFQTRLDGTDDLARAIGCDVCIVADRSGTSSVEWQEDEGLAMLRQLASHLPATPIVFAGVAQTGLMWTAARELGLSRTRLIGSATEAFASAARAITAMEGRCSPRDVMLTVLGTPPAKLVVPWSEASIGGYALERVLEPVQLNRLEARLPRLWPPGPYALGMAAAVVTEAILTASRSSFSVMTMLAGEFGVSNRIGAVPALLASPGIVHTRTPRLNTKERVLLGTALEL